jgi:hypothetical protein
VFVSARGTREPSKRGPVENRMAVIYHDHDKHGRRVPTDVADSVQVALLTFDRVFGPRLSSEANPKKKKAEGNRRRHLLQERPPWLRDRGHAQDLCDVATKASFRLWPPLAVPISPSSPISNSKLARTLLIIESEPLLRFRGVIGCLCLERAPGTPRKAARPPVKCTKKGSIAKI